MSIDRLPSRWPPVLKAGDRFRATFESLGNRNWRLYFTGQTVSITGTWMQRVSQAWLVLEITDSGTWLGFAAALQQLPFLLVGVWGGLLADRVDKRRLLLCTQSLAGVCALVLGLLVVSGRVELWMVLSLAFGLGIVNSLDHPARHSFVIEMVGRQHVTNAVTLNSVIVNVGRAVGPGVAGGVIAVFGLGAAFLVNAASYLAVVTALVLIRTAELYSVPPTHRRRGQLREGLRQVRGNPDLVAPLILLTVVGLLAVEFQVKIPLLAKYAFDGDAGTYGTMFSVMGIGAVLGGLAVAGSLRSSRRALLTTAVVFGVLLVVTSASPLLFLAYVSIFLLGAANVAFKSTANAILQLRADPDMRGRVMSLSGIALRGTTPIAAPLAGWMAETAGARFPLGFGGGVTIAAAVGIHWYLRRRDPETPITEARENAGGPESGNEEVLPVPPGGQTDDRGKADRPPI